jgi:hypothetical protein
MEHKFKDREKMQFNLDTWQAEKEGRIILPENRKRYKINLEKTGKKCKVQYQARKNHGEIYKLDRKDKQPCKM